MQVDIETNDWQPSGTAAGDPVGEPAGGDPASANAAVENSSQAGSDAVVRVNLRVRWAGAEQGVGLTGFALPVSEAQP